MLLMPSKFACWLAASLVFSSWILCLIASVVAFDEEEVGVFDVTKPFEVSEPICWGCMPIPPVAIELPGKLTDCCGRLLNEEDPAVIEPPALMAGEFVGGFCKAAVAIKLRKCGLLSNCCCWALVWANDIGKFTGAIGRGCWDIIPIFGVIADLLGCFVDKGVDEVGAGVELFEAALFVPVSKSDKNN